MSAIRTPTTPFERMLLATAAALVGKLPEELTREDLEALASGEHPFDPRVLEALRMVTRNPHDPAVRMAAISLMGQREDLDDGGPLACKKVLA